MKMNLEQKKAYNRLVKWGDWVATQIPGISGASQSPISFFNEAEGPVFDTGHSASSKPAVRVKMRKKKSFKVAGTETRPSVRRTPEYWPHRMEAETDIFVNSLNPELKAFAQCVFEFKKIIIFKGHSYAPDLTQLNLNRLISLTTFISQQKSVKFQPFAA